MTPLDETLRAAFLDTAGEIPAEAPPLRLPTRRRPWFRPGRRRWIGWVAPLGAAAVVVALIAASLALAGGIPRPQASGPAGLTAIPPYYVALTTQKPDSAFIDYGAAAAEVRSTATGAVLAKVVPPRPYVAFTGITAAADDRTFVLSAQEPYRLPVLSQRQMFREYPNGYEPDMRFFLLRINPASPSRAGRTSLRALPAGYIPAKDTLHDMALSPDGTALAADIGGQLRNDRLYVFNLATGATRAWSARGCPECSQSSGGLGYGGVNADALSWTADGRHLAFVWGGTLRLLDTGDPGSNLLTDSRTVAVWASPTTPQTAPQMSLRGAIITPDDRTALAVEELSTEGPNITVREQLVKLSTATRKPAQILDNLNALALNGYEQILYANASGSVLVLTFTRPGLNAVIFHDGRYTPIPWSPYIGLAAW
jgi:hypothetical protein